MSIKDTGTEIYEPFPQPNEADTNLAKIQVIEKFKRWSVNPMAAVVDCETTSLNGEVFEVCIKRVYDNETLIHFVSHSDREFIGRSLEFHADRIDEIRNAPPKEQFIEQLRDVMQQYDLLAYNSDFDQKMILKTYGIYKPFECIMKTYSIFSDTWNDKHASWGWKKLIEACINEGVHKESDPQPHRADEDVDMEIQLIKAVAKKDVYIQ